jgi:2-phosphoglycerate kinase
MRKIILIGGDLASGKSTYSRFLAEKFNLSLINKDILKEILGDNIKTSNREENKKLSKISFDLIKYFIETTQDDIIVESNFKPYEMVELEKYLNENEILSLHFKGDNKELHERFQKRLKENRHEVHKSQDFTDINDFINVLEELRSVKYIGTVIDVDVSKYLHITKACDITEKVAKFLQK